MLDITKLQNRRADTLEYSDIITLDKDIYKNTDIRDLSPIDVKIIIRRVTDYSYDMNIELDGVMTLPCSVTLKDVLYPFHIENTVKLSNDDEIDEDYVKITQNTIDIIPIIWQNILLEIPLRVVSEDVSDLNTSGDGWKLIRDE